MANGQVTGDMLADEGWWPTAGVFASVAVFGALTALAAPQWFDSAEFAAAGQTLGLSHPPGHPLHAMVVRAFQLLPFGDVALRSNVSSFLLLAAALALFYRLLRRVVPEAPFLACAAGALLLAALPNIWEQAARCEVYTLEFLIGILIAGGAHRLATRRDPRELVLLGFIVGIGGSLHSLITMAWIPVLIWAVAVGLPRTAVGARALVLSVASGLFGLALFAYLPLRALAGAENGWGAPDSFDDVVASATGRQWTAGAPVEVDLLANLGDVAVHVIQQAGAIATASLLLVLACAVPRLVRTRDHRVGPAALLIAATFGSRVIFPLDLTTPDFGGYVMAGYAAMVLIALVAACHLRPLHRSLRFAPYVLVAALLLAAPGYDLGQRAGSRTAGDTARAMLLEVEPGGTLSTSQYSTAFLAWYLRVVEGLRPDVPLVFAPQVHAPWAARRLAVHYPDTARRLAGYPATFHRRSDHREIGVVVADDEALLRPFGLTLVPDGPLAGVDVVAARYRDAFGAAGPGRDIDSLRWLGLHHMLMSVQAVHYVPGPVGLELARWHVARARAGHDEMLEALEAELERLPPDADMEQRSGVLR